MFPSVLDGPMDVDSSMTDVMMHTSVIKFVQIRLFALCMTACRAATGKMLTTPLGNGSLSPAQGVCNDRSRGCSILEEVTLSSSNTNLC